MATVQRENNRLDVRFQPGEILHLPIRKVPLDVAMNTLLIHAAWELVTIHKPEKLVGLTLDKANVDFIDGLFEVCFYPKGAV